MNLKIECADKNGDVFIDLVDRSSPRHPKLIATMERGFDMKENAQVIAKRVNAFEEGGLVDELKVACEVGLDSMRGMLEMAVKFGASNKDKREHAEHIKFAEAALAKS